MELWLTIGKIWYQINCYGTWINSGKYIVTLLNIIEH